MKLVMAAALIVGCGAAAKGPASDLERTEVPAAAGTQEAVAARSNDSGIEAMRAGRYEQASIHFRDAVARVPIPSYFFNLCSSMFHEGKLAEARVACGAVIANAPNTALADKAHALVSRIEADAQARGVRFDGGGTTGPSDTSPADDQAKIASELDEAGMALVTAARYAVACAKFREAVARVPDAKYFLHLCTSLYQEGKFSDALAACDAVGPQTSSAGSAAALRDRIVAEARAQGILLTTSGGPATPPVVEADAAPPPSGGQAALAAKLSDEGEKLVHAQKYAEASARFREAVARVPEPKYFYNLCTSLFQEGKFSEALSACAGGKRNYPSAALAAKIDAMIARIRAEAKAQNISLEIH